MGFLIRHKTILTLIFAFMFCIVSLALQSTSFTSSVEGAGSALVMPFQKVYNFTIRGLGLMWAGVTELNGVREELSKTRQKLQQYVSINDELEEIKRENARLRLMLGFRERIVYQSMPARIISKDPDNWFRTIVINKGKNDGIAVNMPVVAFTGDEKAVVGKVVEVRGSISRVLPLISPDMKTGVQMQLTRSPGLMVGQSANSDRCVIDYISKSEQLNKGDKIITSGGCGIFPPGLLVGVVEEGVVNNSSAFQKAIVKPLVDYNKIEEVFVILKIPDRELIELIEGY